MIRHSSISNKSCLSSLILKWRQPKMGMTHSKMCKKTRILSNMMLSCWIFTCRSWTGSTPAKTSATSMKNHFSPSIAREDPFSTMTYVKTSLLTPLSNLSCLKWKRRRKKLSLLLLRAQVCYPTKSHKMPKIVGSTMHSRPLTFQIYRITLCQNLKKGEGVF